MTSSDDKAEGSRGDFGMPDMTQWKSEVDAFLSEARREIRRIRTALAAEPQARESNLPESRDAVAHCQQREEPTPSPASQHPPQDGNGNPLQSLKQRLAEQIDRCSATGVHE